MILRRIRIVALPGIDAPFELADLTEGVIVVHGPNASGKSSVGRALHAVLDRSAYRRRTVHVEAAFTIGKASWTVRRVGDAVAWERNGAAAPSPLPDPPDPVLDPILRIEDLVASGADDAATAERIAIEAAGGFDRTSARAALPSAGPRHGAAEAKVDRDARTRLRAVREAHAALERDRAELDADRATRDAARIRAAERERIERARELARDLREAATAEAERDATFPSGMDRVREDDVATAERARRRAAEARGRAQEERDRARSHEREVDATGLVAEVPNASVTSFWSAALEAVAEEERAERRAAERLAEAEVARRAARADGATGSDDADDGGRVGPDGRALDVEAIAAIADAEVALRTARLRIRDAEATYVQAWRAAEPNGDPGVPEREAERCRARLDALVAARGREPSGRRVARAFASGASASVAAVVGTDLVLRFGTGVDPAETAARAVLAVLAAAAAVLARPGPSRTAALAPYLAAGGAPSGAWTDATLTRRIHDESDRLAAVRTEQHRMRTTALDLARAERLVADARAEDAAAESTLTEAGRAAGLPLEAATLRTGERLRRSSLVRDAETAAARARAAHRCAAEALVRRSEELASSLAPVPPPQSAAPSETSGAADDSARSVAHLRARVHDATERVRRRDQALAARLHALRAAEAADAEAHDAEEALVAVLVRATDHDPSEIRNDPEAALGAVRERARAIPAWRTAEQRIRTARARAEGHRSVLADRPDLVAMAETGDEAALMERFERARSAEAEADAAADRIARTEERLRAAEAAEDLHRASETAARARDALELAREAALDDAVASFVLDRAFAEHRRTSRPALLRRAERWFAAFARYRFALVFDDERSGAERIRVRDTTRGVTVALVEASSGTRVQALLAVRLARRVEEEPADTRVPVVLDDALASTDPQRFDAVARALVAWADAEGRQVTHLTPRSEDVEVWRAACAGRVPFRAIDLGRLRTESIRTPPIRTGPGGATPFAAYPPDATPLALLAPDRPAWAQRAAASGADTVGAVAAWADTAVHVPAPERREAVRRIAAFRAWANASGFARNRGVDLAALRTFGGLSERFLAPVAERADAWGGDPEAFLDDLRTGSVPYLRQGTIDALARWMRETDLLGRTDGVPDRSAPEREAVAAARAEVDGADEDRVRAWIAAWEASLSPES